MLGIRRHPTGGASPALTAIGGRRAWRAIFFAVLAALGVLGARRASAQVSIADDIILAAQGKENAERAERNRLGRKPGADESPYTRSPGTTDVVLGETPTDRVRPLRRVAQRQANPAEILTPAHGRSELGHGLAPTIERLPPALLTNDHLDSPLHDGFDEGPPDGMTIDDAINLMIHHNPELRSKGREIPQAQADILTAGLRENPLLFYSSDGVPYGSYSEKRPGDIEHGLSLVVPIDYSGKRRARVSVAEREKEVMEAQYRDAVRVAIDDLAVVFVDVLSMRAAADSAEQGLGLIDQLLAEAREKDDEILVDDLLIERELALMSLDDERSRYSRAKRSLGVLLHLAPEETEAIEVRGALDDLGPELPPTQTLIPLALAKRPDLRANRLGLQLAEAQLGLQRANRFSDAYFLYAPFTQRDNSKNNNGERSITTWGAGVFVSIPLFNRNQGNVRRAQLNIAQSGDEIAVIEAQVIAEVRQAVEDYQNTREDAIRLKQVILPAVRRKRDRAWAKMESGDAGADQFLAVQRDSTTLVAYHRENLARHRRNAWKLNAAVGHRVLP